MRRAAGLDERPAGGAGTGGAVFLDRDGVISEVVFRDGNPASARSLEEFVLRAEAPAEVERLRAAGLRVFLITNQPDVARGLLEPATHEAIMELTARHLRLDAWQACTHDGDACACRKPKPGMIHVLARAWGVDPRRSYMVGDTWKDMQAGDAAGCTTVLLRRPYNDGTAADHQVEGLRDAVDWILGREAAAVEMSYAEHYLREAREVLERLEASALESMVAALADLREQGGRLFFIGVGGGAGHASHAVNDFRKIAGIESYAPTDNVSELTARVNDDGWESSYAEYLRGSRLRSVDGLFIFSVGGGNLERNVSANIVSALTLARQVGARIFGVVGRDGGYTAQVANHCIIVPTVNPETVTPHTEAFQAVVWHLLVSHPKLQRHAMKWESLEDTAGVGSGV